LEAGGKPALFDDLVDLGGVVGLVNDLGLVAEPVEQELAATA